jgi:L-rhamnose mutarotase
VDGTPDSTGRSRLMGRMLFHLRLYPGTEAKFDRAHSPVPADLASAVRDAALRNFTAFRRGTDVWCYGESDATAVASLDRFVAAEGYRRWRDSVIDVVAPAGPSADLDRYDEIFHSDGPPLKGPSRRGMFMLVVHPDRIAEYDLRHANPWPDMMEALADSGFRNYSGFRNGSLAAYYGEFFPDMATATATIGKTDVNRRWGESFHGIITTITDDERRLLTADEILHLD